MRLLGRLPWAKVVDGHRLRHAVTQFGGMAEVLATLHGAYRRNYWQQHPVTLEVWCEKDALSGLLLPLCERYGVTYVATRGFPSAALAFQSAAALKRLG